MSMPDPSYPTTPNTSKPIPPRTPSFSRTDTPTSSPRNPQTPHGRVQFKQDYTMGEVEGEDEGPGSPSPSRVVDKGKDLKSGNGMFGPIGVEKVGESSRAARSRSRSRSRSGSASGSGARKVGSSPRRTKQAVRKADGEESEDVDFPEEKDLRGMKIRLQEIDTERDWVEDSVYERDELRKMVNQLLTPTLQHLPYLRQQITAQRDTIATMQEQSRLAQTMMTIEKDRYAAERAGWQAETRALTRVRDAEIAAGTRPKKLLDLDVGYHQELEAANKRLEMDNRLMAPRLQDTQHQIDKLVTELRHLRSHVILSSQPLSLPHTSRSPGQTSRSPYKPTSSTTLGDARTEHLLLAARRVRALRERNERIGRVSLDELKRSGVVGPDGGLGYSEGYGGDFQQDEEEYESDEEEQKPVILETRRSSVKGKTSVPAPSTVGRKKPTKKGSGQAPTTPKGGRTVVLPPTTTPGGSTLGDLLRAAEMADRDRPVGRELKVPAGLMSATRSTTRRRGKGREEDEESGDERGSPHKRARRGSAVGGMASQVVEDKVDGEDGGESALDLLAQASQLEVAQGDSPPQLASAVRFEGMLEKGDKQLVVLDQTLEEEQKPIAPHSPIRELDLAPPIDLRGSTMDPPPTFQSIEIGDHLIDPALNTHQPPQTPTPIQATPKSTHPPLPPTFSTPKPRPRAASTSYPDIHTPARQFQNQLHAPYTDGAVGFEEGGVLGGLRGSSPDNVPLGAYASPTGGTVPGLGKYVHLSNTMPARRIRSPYLKWTVEEDELLARAVALHGEKWDLVSKGVPTRSYHQVRQRWLRKTGAFDKKPMEGGLIHGGSGLMDDEEEELSPTPQPQFTPGGKKRKM